MSSAENSRPVIKFYPGDPALTRRVRKRAEEARLDFIIDYTSNRYGRIVSSYTADVEIYQAVKADLENERSTKKAKLEKTRSAEEARLEDLRRRAEQEARERWLANLPQRFPRLKDPLPYGSTIYESANAIPIEWMCSSDWRRLGYRVQATTAGRYLVTAQGSRVVRLFNSYQVEATQSHRRTWSAAQLWDHYQARGLSVMHAMWAANRLVKIVQGQKWEFYQLKDRFLNTHQHLLVEGRFVRSETKECWDCDGDFGWCERCDGTGIYSQRTLYEHILDDQGKRYSFHSYSRPRALSEARGADLPAYGRRLKRRDQIPYRISEYLLMLKHLAQFWGNPDLADPAV